MFSTKHAIVSGCRVAELEILQGKEHGNHDKLERLEACTESLLQGMRLEHDNVRCTLATLSTKSALCEFCLDLLHDDIRCSLKVLSVLRL